MLIANDPDPTEPYFARSDEHRITCGPRGTDRDTLAAEFRRAHNFAGVPPGSILRAIG